MQVTIHCVYDNPQELAGQTFDRSFQLGPAQGVETREEAEVWMAFIYGGAHLTAGDGSYSFNVTSWTIS